MWQLQDGLAQVESPSFRATLKLSQPGAGMDGMNLILPESKTVIEPGTILRVMNVLGPAADVCSRGDDLIANFTLEQDPSVLVQVYWRALNRRALSSRLLAGFELIVSVHTSTLDCEPELVVGGKLPSGSLAQSENSLLIEPAGAPYMYLEVVHPSNYDQTSIEAADDPSVSWAHAFFTGHLEKGVIRRGRIRGYFLEACASADTTIELRDSFLESDPPLTR